MKPKSYQPTRQKFSNRFAHVGAAALVVMSLGISLTAFGQVSPKEIVNPRLKSAEQTYFKQLLELKQALDHQKFAYPFHLSRFVGLEIKDQTGSDARGLEFVNFHDRTVLKVTGNYNAAFNAALTTTNQRANRVFDEVISPIMQQVARFFSARDQFNDLGFEIAYHVRSRTHDYDYEGKEILVVVLEKTDAFDYLDSRDEEARQEILNRSEIYLNGKKFGLALGQSDALNIESLDKSGVNRTLTASFPQTLGTAGGSEEHSRVSDNNPLSPSSKLPNLSNSGRRDATATPKDAQELQTKYQPQLDVLAKEGTAKYHFVDYAPPAFVIFRNQIFLQLTLRNPASFNQESTSIYKRTAQSFDLFFAPQIKAVLDKIPETAEFAGLDVTILNTLTASSGRSSEALELISPLSALRQFANAEITNQELVNQSVVMVNGVRIAINLQQVE